MTREPVNKDSFHTAEISNLNITKGCYLGLEAVSRRASKRPRVSSWSRSDLLDLGLDHVSGRRLSTSWSRLVLGAQALVYKST